MVKSSNIVLIRENRPNDLTWFASGHIYLTAITYTWGLFTKSSRGLRWTEEVKRNLRLHMFRISHSPSNAGFGRLPIPGLSAGG